MQSSINNSLIILKLEQQIIIIIIIIIKTNIMQGPSGFTEKEMTGISDSFSFVSQENDKDMKKSYNFVDEKEQEEDIFSS